MFDEEDEVRCINSMIEGDSIGKVNTESVLEKLIWMISEWGKRIIFLWIAPKLHAIDWIENFLSQKSGKFFL